MDVQTDKERGTGEDEEDWILAVPIDAVRDRCHVSVKGRFVSIIRTRENKFYAFDSICYHAGGPLGVGEIEEIIVDNEALSCIKCPWHHYTISLVDGKKFYNSLERDEASGKLVPAGWKSSDIPLQRIHDVEARADGIYIRLSLEDTIRSDKYAYRADCAAGLSGSRRGARTGADGSIRTKREIAGQGQFKAPLPSGHIFKKPEDNTPLVPGPNSNSSNSSSSSPFGYIFSSATSRSGGDRK